MDTTLVRPLILPTQAEASPRRDSISLDTLRQAIPDQLWETPNELSTPAFIPPGTPVSDNRIVEPAARAQTIATEIGEAQSLKYPFRCIGKIRRKRPGEDWTGAGSGVLVGPWHLLTASHVLHNDTPPGTIFKFFPAYWDGDRSGDIGFRWFEANIISTIGITVIDDVNGYDYLVCELDNPLGLDWGWLATQSSSNDGFYTNIFWTSIGYPSDLGGKRPQGNLFTITDVKEDDHNSKEIIGQGDVNKGWSGGPLYGPALWTGDTVVGVLSGAKQGTGTGNPDRVTFSGGKEMTRLVRYARDNWKRSDWSGWFNIEFPGQFSGDLAICSASPDHLQLFGVGMDGQMYSQYWLDAEGWSNWIPMGGLFNPGTNPAAISRKPNTIEVFCRGRDNTVYQNYWPHSGTGDWSGWFNIEFPGQFSGDLAICSTRTDHLQLFGAGLDGQMYSQYWLDAEGWSNWIPMAGLFNPGTNPAAISRKPDTIEVFCRGKNDTVYQNYWPRPIDQ